MSLNQIYQEYKMLNNTVMKMLNDKYSEGNCDNSFSLFPVTQY